MMRLLKPLLRPVLRPVPARLLQPLHRPLLGRLLQPLLRLQCGRLSTVRHLLTILPLLACCTAHAQPGLGRLFNTPQERQAIDASHARPNGGSSPHGVAGVDAGGIMAGMAPGMQPQIPATSVMPAGMPPLMQATPGMAQGMPMQPAASMPQGAGPGMAQATAPGMAPGTLPLLAPDIVPDLPPNLPAGMAAEMMAAARAARAQAPAQSAAAVMAQQQQQQQQRPPSPQQMPMPMPMPASASAATVDTALPAEQLTMNGVLRTSNGRSTVWLNNQPQRGAANKFSNRDSKAVTVTLPSGKRVVLQPGQRYDLADGRVKDVGQ